MDDTLSIVYDRIGMSCVVALRGLGATALIDGNIDEHGTRNHFLERRLFKQPWRSSTRGSEQPR
jgi:hypothetical protein